MQAAPLACGQDILVCPTNAGATVGVDLLERRLAWVHVHPEKPAARTPAAEDLIRKGIVPPRGPALGPDGWKISAPIIQDGKVVIAAPDGASLHCLNLRDGSLVWKVPRAEKDLYLAGIIAGKVLLVGKENVRALALADGKQLWQLATGMPSGRGVASEGIYYLPLRAAAATKEPEVCLIDVEKGIIAAHTRSRRKEVPGNLLFYEGDVLSQTIGEICAYPQLRVKLEEIDRLLKANPKDPQGLFERGELRRDRGDLAGTVEDLRAALENRPPQELLPRIRGLLYETLTEWLQRDFSAAEKHLELYRELLKPAAPGPKEERQRQANYFFLLGAGRERQGKLADALDAYLAFAVPAADGELLSSTDEPAVKARPDVWARGRIAALLASATPEQRRLLEERIAARGKEVRKGDDLDALRRFIALYGAASPAGRDTILALALGYDRQRLEIVEVRRGSLTADFDLFLVNLDSAAGTIRVGLGRTLDPIEGRGQGSVVEVIVRILPDAAPGRTVVNLRAGVGATTTQLNEGRLDLNPDPTDAEHDAVDGVIRIRSAAPVRTASAERFTSMAGSLLGVLLRERRRGTASRMD
jgi:hypothetical protein